MSDTETGKTIVPPFGVFALDPSGLLAWNAVFDGIAIHPLPGGRRQLKVTVADALVYQRTLTAEEASHLAKLLTG